MRNLFNILIASLFILKLNIGYSSSEDKDYDNVEIKIDYIHGYTHDSIIIDFDMLY